MVCKCIFFLCISLTLGCVHVCVCICVLYMHVYMFNMCGNILCAQMHRHIYLHPCGELRWAISDHCPSYSLRPGLSMEPKAHGYWIILWPVYLDIPLCFLTTGITVMLPMGHQSTVTSCDLQYSCGFWDPNSSPHMFPVRTLTTHQSLQLNCDFFYRRQ